MITMQTYLAIAACLSLICTGIVSYIIHRKGKAEKVVSYFTKHGKKVNTKSTVMAMMSSFTAFMLIFIIAAFMFSCKITVAQDSARGVAYKSGITFLFYKNKYIGLNSTYLDNQSGDTLIFEARIIDVSKIGWRGMTVNKRYKPKVYPPHRLLPMPFPPTYTLEDDTYSFQTSEYSGPSSNPFDDRLPNPAEDIGKTIWVLYPKFAQPEELY